MISIGLLILLAIAANSTMDEIDHRWSRWFGKVIKPGSNLVFWMNPRLSWVNKHFKNKFVTFIFSTLLVWLTDFWHLLKFIFLNSIFAIVIILAELDWRLLLIFNLGWGVVFELFFTGVYGMLSDGVLRKRKK